MKKLVILGLFLAVLISFFTNSTIAAGSPADLWIQSERDPGGQKDLVLGAYNVAGRFSFSTRKEVFMDSLTLSIEGEPAKVHDVTIRRAGDMKEMGKVVSVAGGIVTFSCHWVIPTDTTQVVIVQLRVDGNYWGPLQVSVVGVGAYIVNVGKAWVEGLPCKADFLMGGLPSCDLLVSQIMQLEAQLFALGDNNPDLANQIRAQIKALVDALKKYCAYADFSVKVSCKKSSALAPIRTDRSNTPIVDSGAIVRIEFVRIAGVKFRYTPYFSDEFARNLGPVKKDPIKITKQGPNFVEFKVQSVQKMTRVSFDFGSSPMIWQNWHVASGIVIFPKNDCKGAPPIQGFGEGVTTWGLLKK